MIYINLTHGRQSWQHSLPITLFLILLGSYRQEMDLGSLLCSQVSLFFPPDGNEWIMMRMGFAECSNMSSQGKINAGNPLNACYSFCNM